jgi:flagellar biosynthesis protein FliQ
MDMNDWIAVGVAIVGGLVVGVIASRIVSTMLGKPSRPKPIQDAARPLSSLAMSFGLVVGLIVALGIIQPDAVEQLRTDAVSFIPKVLTAVIIVILANVLSSFAVAALGTALARAPLKVQRQVSGVTRGLILVMAILLAVGTLGVDTTVVNLGVAAVFFAAAASFTLLVGMGGREVASEVASTRAVRRLVSVGDVIAIGLGDSAVRGKVVALHPTALEIEEAGEIVLVPSSRLLSETMHVERAGSAPPSDF